MDIQKLINLVTGFLILAFVLVVALFATSVTMVVNPDAFKDNDLAVSKPVEKPWAPKNPFTDLSSASEEVQYGYQLLAETPAHIGPAAERPEMRFAGNNLACKNCHLGSGTQAGSASWVGVANRFPQFRGRENKIGTLEERINGCMERSMNGKVLPDDSKEMQAMIAYMEWLSEDVPADQEARYKGFPKVAIPDYAADPEKGKTIYVAQCQVCHAEDGQGIRLAGTDSVKGYQYPPLWGNDTYNHGAGMNRVLTAAQFIKGNMPFGATVDNPILTDEEAYHVAAYIDSFDRPLKSNPEADFPDKKLKPVSTPYGPWEDDFSAEQHKYGPFPPIIAFYKEKYDIKKTK